MNVIGTAWLNGCNYQVGYDLLKQDIANNYSVIRLYGILNVTNNYISWSRGTAQVWNTSVGIATRYNKGSYTLVSEDVTIYHESNGTKTVYVGGSLNTTYLSGTAGGNISLPTIPRQANVTRFDNFNDEENPTIYFNNPGGFKINARLEFAGVSITRNNIPNIGSYKFELTEEERELIRNKTPNSNTMGIRGVIGTCIGQEAENYWSYVDRIVNIVNANPIFNNFVYEDIEEKSLMLTNNSQLLIKNISRIVLSPDLIETKKGATPKHYTITFDNKIITVNHESNLLHINIDNINFSGNKRLSVRAYDSRNNSTEIFKDVMILDYNEPKIYSTLERKNQFEKEARLKINGKYDELKINDEAKNQLIKLKYRYRETGGILGEWIDVSIIQENSNYNCNDIILNLDNAKSYEFEIYVEDKLKSNVFSIGVGVGIPAFFISSNKKAIGVNCIPPEDAKDGEIYFKSSDGIVKSVLDYDIIEEFEEE